MSEREERAARIETNIMASVARKALAMKDQRIAALDAENAALREQVGRLQQAFKDAVTDYWNFAKNAGELDEDFDLAREAASFDLQPGDLDPPT